VDGQLLHADFVKIAVNVIRDTPQGPNVLPDLLWRWFGPEAGQPGTAHRVLLKVTDTGDWLVTPHRAGEDPPQTSASLVL
jgi:hypothetical protein